MNESTFRFDRSRFEALELDAVVAEQSALKQQLQSYDELLASPTVEATPNEAEAQTALEEGIANASAELERRFQALAAAASAGQPISLERLRGLGDLWTVVHSPELHEAILTAHVAQPERPTPEVEMERQRILQELAEHEAEITLRLAERQLNEVGGSVDGPLRDELVRAVFRRYFSDEEEDTLKGAPPGAV